VIVHFRAFLRNFVLILYAGFCAVLDERSYSINHIVACSVHERCSAISVYHFQRVPMFNEKLKYFTVPSLCRSVQWGVLVEGETEPWKKDPATVQ